MMNQQQYEPTFIVEALQVHCPMAQQSINKLRLQARSPEEAIEKVRANGQWVVRIHLVEQGHLKVRSWDVETDGSLTPCVRGPDSLLLRRPILTIAIAIASGISIVIAGLILLALVTGGGELTIT
jgi:hypothetical protein